MKLIKNPRKVLLLFQENDKQKILGLANRIANFLFCFLSEAMKICAISWVVYSERSSTKEFSKQSHSKSFRFFFLFFKQTSNLPSFVECFKVRFYWFGRKGWSLKLVVTFTWKKQGLRSCRWEKLAIHATPSVAGQLSWVFSSKDTVIKKRTQTKDPPQN